MVLWHISRFGAIAHAIIANLRGGGVSPPQNTATLLLQSAELLFLKHTCGMPFFQQGAVILDDEQVRDAARMQIERIAALRPDHGELDIMLFCPCQRLSVIPVTRKVNEFNAATASEP